MTVERTLAGEGSGRLGLPTAGQAAYNNAAWCDAVSRAHGGVTEYGAGLWRNHRPAPPFYPNAVTLDPAASAAQLEGVRGLLAEGLPGGFGVKDSYCALDLAALGFGLLFEAEWLGRPAGAGSAALPGTRVARVTSEGELARWEAGWQGEGAGPRLFLPALLGDPALAFLAVYEGERIVAGLIANRSDDGTGAVAGVSNIYLPAEDGEDFRPALLESVEAAFPGLPLVGYEHGADLAAMLALGFEGLGALRVWTAPERPRDGTNGAAAV